VNDEKASGAVKKYPFSQRFNSVTSPYQAEITMNWFKAFWMGLSVPPEAAREIRAHPPKPNTPAPGIRMDGRSPLENFTPRAQQVLALSRKEAERFHHNFVGTEHLLLGLLALGQGVAVNVLMKMGLDLGTCRAEVEKQVGIGPDQQIIGNIPFTPRVKKVLAFAAKEAKALNHTYVGTEHILLGILREGDGVAARVLNHLQVDIERTRQEILRELDPNHFSLPDSIDRIPSSAPGDPPVDRSELGRDLFTPRVRRAFTLAREEAEQRNQPLVETQHVLLGLIRMGQGVAADVLIKIGVNAQTVAARMENPAAPESAEKVAEAPPFAPLVKEVLSFAAEEARALDHTYIGTEHILLGLLRQPHGGAARIFKELYVDTNALRQQIVIAFEVKTFAPPRDKNLEASGPKDTEMFAKKTPATPRPAPVQTHREPVDTAQRYDVYCMEPNEKTVIYRNVQFKAHKGLFPRNDYDHSSDFVELEQSDGQKIFIAKSSIIRFCPPGVKPGIEDA
jgi:ClpA/ClpB-like protein